MKPSETLQRRVMDAAEEMEVLADLAWFAGVGIEMCGCQANTEAGAVLNYFGRRMKEVMTELRAAVKES